MKVGHWVQLLLTGPGFKIKSGLTGKIVKVDGEEIWVEFDVRAQGKRALWWCERFKAAELIPEKNHDDIWPYFGKMEEENEMEVE